MRRGNGEDQSVGNRAAHCSTARPCMGVRVRAKLKVKVMVKVRDQCTQPGATCLGLLALRPLPCPHSNPN